MKKFRRIFSATLFVLTFVSLCSADANAQQVPNYLFVEVLDSKGAPVKGATVEAANHQWENEQLKENWFWGRETDEAGKARTMLRRGDTGLDKTAFRIAKPGYFPFYDLGTLGTSNERFAKIELLKIPASPEERKALGEEQSKREFLRAVKNGDVETVRKLLKAGISPNLNSDDLRGASAPKNVPAIIYAAATGNAEMVKIFLKAGVNIKQKTEPMRNIMAYYLSANPFARGKPKNEEEAMREYESGVWSLIEAGAEIKKFPSEFGNRNALMLAAQSGNLNLVKLFLEKGVSVNDRDHWGQTVLFYAPDAMFDFLLESGADPNIVASPDKSSCNSILMHVVWSGDIKLIKTLLAYKADVNFTCPNGNNAIKTASERKNYGYMNNTDEVIKLLEAAGAK